MTGLKFDFTDLEAPRVKDVKCPLCGGAIVKTMFGYGCANYSKDNPASCRFSIGRIAGVTLKEAQVKELLLRGRTEVISGFVAKTGMKFDASGKLPFFDRQDRRCDLKGGTGEGASFTRQDGGDFRFCRKDRHEI